jgi:hypothetical protein
MNDEQQDTDARFVLDLVGARILEEAQRRARAYLAGNVWGEIRSAIPPALRDECERAAFERVTAREAGALVRALVEAAVACHDSGVPR